MGVRRSGVFERLVRSGSSFQVLETRLAAMAKCGSKSVEAFYRIFTNETRHRNLADLSIHQAVYSRNNRVPGHKRAAFIANFVFVKPAASKPRTCDKKTDVLGRGIAKEPPTLELPLYGQQKVF